MKSPARATVALFVSLGLTFTPWSNMPADAASSATVPRPQIVIAIGNSQSMDGDLSGAIMTGSGSLSSGLSSLSNSSSPVNYTVPTGFTPPVQAANSSGLAPYTVNQSGTLYDNGASRLNVAKAGIMSVLNQYLPSMDFALEDYSTEGSTKYSTWVYYMSPNGGFTFTNTKTNALNYVDNPCYTPPNSTLSTTISSNCSSIASLYSGMTSSKYMQISTLANDTSNVGATSDNPGINDVLYAPSNLPGVWVDYGGTYVAQGSHYGATIDPAATPPTTPYTYYSLADYEANGVTVGYKTSKPTLPNPAYLITGPTNAGYVPYSNQVMYAQRGFGYYVTSIDQTTGNPVVPMTNLGSNPSSSTVTTALAPFQTALKPETNSSSTSEIKALAWQSPIAGLMQGAGSILKKLPVSCAGQYVILVTDGLPTEDSSGNSWPPLGSMAGAAIPNGYGVNAAFYGIAGNAAYGINDDLNNPPPNGNTTGSVTGALDISKTNDQALIDAVKNIAALNSGPNPIKTYVIGLGAGVNANANPAAYAALNAMAIAGGTGQEYPANNVPAFSSALNSIAGQIFSSIAVSAPVAPTSITAGSLIYTATSNNVPGSIAGHVQAYQTVALPTSSASAPVGTASGPAIWDAGDATHMPASLRQTSLYSTGPTPSSGSPPAGSGAVVNLANMGNSNSANYDPAAFALTPNTCVPNIGTILDFTFDPSYNAAGDTTSPAYPAGPSGCSYLAGRQLNWMLGGLSPNDHVQYLGPPGNANLLNLGGYVSFAQNNNGREKLLLFTSNDGFLYAADAGTGTTQGTGKLVWGWMPRPFVANLQNYTGFETGQFFDGGFTMTDAVDTSSSPQASDWATYVVGTAQGGAYHYALKLSSNGSSTSNAPATPQAQTWGVSTSGGSSPQLQAPVIVTVNGSQYAVFVVNTTTGTGTSAVTSSTLYEVNVATGQPASGTAISAALSLGSKVYVNSSLTYAPSTGTLWFGDSNGGVWSVNVSGAAGSDAGGAVQVATTNPLAPINYVGYTEIGGLPYVWAATQSEITAFGLSGGTSKILWASSGTSGYQPGSGGTLQSVASSVVMPLQAGAQISAAPVLVNGVLVVPAYVPPSGTACGVGTGYYDLFDLLTGGLPKITIRYKNNAVTNGVISLGAGIPLSPSVYVTPTGTVIYPGSSQPPNPQQPNPISPINFGGNVMNKPIAWRQY
ncbi:hypothetical protein GALL_177490 [mine drainage metagenome]|uniref:Uncharacterized protein n=1 Tax=mine drainage metagenome TaxID=410659 RepID=A0A1J5RWT5_9ZZZZ